MRVPLPSPAPTDRLGWFGNIADMVVLSVLLAVALRWPVSLFPAALSHDPNTALHAVAAADLATWADPFVLTSLDWPGGVPVRLIGWPMLLVAAPLQAALDPIAALNVGLTLLLAAQGVGVGLVGLAEGWPRARRLGTVAAAMLAPLAALHLGNGQPENVVFLPLLLAGWGAARGRWGWCALGLLLAAASTPYAGLVAGLLALAGGLNRGRRGLATAAVVGLACALPVGAYFGSQAAGAPGADLTRTRPADAAFAAPATLAGLVTPDPGLDAGLGPPGWATPDRRWPQTPPATGSYLGLGLLLLGGAGLWRGRREPLVRAVAGAGLVSFVLALGARLTLAPGSATALPLPWAALQVAPGLREMGATARFLMGVELALAVGVGRLVAARGGAAAAAALVLLVDALGASPGHWPVAASSPRSGPLVAALPPGPTLLWPGTPLLSTHQHAVLRLALDRPVASFNGPPPADTTLPPGARPPAPTRNLRGETPATWARRVSRAGARGLLEVTPLPPDHRQPLVDGPGVEVGELTVYRLPAGDRAD